MYSTYKHLENNDDDDILIFIYWKPFISRKVLISHVFYCCHEDNGYLGNFQVIYADGIHAWIFEEIVQNFHKRRIHNVCCNPVNIPLFDH